MRALLSLVLAMCLAGVVLGWGPASHYYFTRSGLSGVSTAATMSGTEMPDAFFFGSQVTGSNCTGVGALHNLVYGGFLVKTALKSNPVDKDLLNLGLGFGAHVVGDYAGFFPGGFIGMHIDIPRDTNWVATWPYMTAIDAYVAQAILSPANDSYVPTLSTAQASFMKAARDAMAAAIKTPGMVPEIDASQISECANVWRHVVQRETKKSMVMPAASYQWEMIYNSQYGATSFSQVEKEFNMAASCAIQMIGKWEKLIMDPATTPVEANAKVMADYEGLFKAGKCAPLK